MKRKFDPYSRANQLIVDGAIFTFSFAAAFLIRFEGLPPYWAIIKQFLLWLPYLLAARLIVNWKLGIYRFIWRYVSLSDAVAIATSLAVVTELLLALRIFYPGSVVLAKWVRVPLSIIALEYLLSMTGMLAARALRRILYERGERNALVADQGTKRVVLYGAGRAGIMLLKELQNHPMVEVVGFVDDDPKKLGTVILGARVLGSGKALQQIARRAEVDEVVISIANAGRKTLADIVAQCNQIGVGAKIIPSLQEIVEGRVSISQLREVRIEDLLGRESIEVTEFDEQVRQVYAGKRVLVTGGGGSIGSELVRQLLLLEPACVAILDKDENSVYELEQELIFRFPRPSIEPMVADVRHEARLGALFEEFKPQVVFHAAAHKHVPLMERHPCEAVLNNVFGTQTLLEACHRNGVERFVYISTDKAVNPANVMGATKRVGEMLVQAYAARTSLASACVRFGNVMGSRGSVIPLFQKQIAEGGPISVTHPDVVRFFMTIPEAVQLVLCTGTLGQQGEVFILDMGNPRKIWDLAHEMVLLSGLQPGKDIEIAISGLRPGEKLEEELVALTETTRPTSFEKISMIVPAPLDGDAISQEVANLLRTAQQNDCEGVYNVLSTLGLRPQGQADQAHDAPKAALNR